jgi:ABC-type glutathione transport system ATPase component
MLKIKLSQATPNPLQLSLECTPGELHALVGPSGSGKSFVALDWALCVAAGIPWHGRETIQGKVLADPLAQPYSERTLQ